MRPDNHCHFSEHYILFGRIHKRKGDIDAIISENKRNQPEIFEGKEEFFEFEFRYTEPFDKNFTELKRLQGLAAGFAGRRNEFRGYIVIDLSGYLTHHEDRYLNIMLFFLADMSEFWKYIFIIDDQNLKAARELSGKVLKSFICDNLFCQVIEAREEISAMEQITEVSREAGKKINMELLDMFLMKKEISTRYMLTAKEFDRLKSFFEESRKEGRHGEKEEV